MDTFLDKIREAKAGAKKRKFSQTWDFFINIKNIDLKKPENRFTLDFVLPEGLGKEIKVAMFADSLLIEAKKYADLVITKQEIETYAKNKKKLKKMMAGYDWFFGEASLMAVIGKTLGIVMGPRGKMPRPVPPRVKIEPIIKNAKNSVRISLKDNTVIHVPIGKETMEEEKVAANAEAVFQAVTEKLPKGIENIRSAHIKLTMGKPVKINVR